MINLDYQSRKPIYMQIVNGIERYVALEILKPEQQIPSIRDLATELGVNPNTVKKAYSILEQRGVIVTLSTKGTFITIKTDKVFEKTVEEKIEEIKKQINELEKFGIDRKEIIKRISK
ncbi:MAG: GntR family transcriptional regulator [Clostridia bacterium]|nr:GntR family transcriptional regulator [Clostridia bacterium]